MKISIVETGRLNMLSRLADVLVPAIGRLTITAVVLAALHRLGARPVVMAAAGLWHVPVLGRALTRGGHIPVYRSDRRAANALDSAAEALERDHLVLIYAEGGLPHRRDSAEAAPGIFRSGLSRLVQRTGAPVVPLGQAGARRITSGSVTKQLAGLFTAPLRRPELHVHVGKPLELTGDGAVRTERARTAVTAAWRTAR